MREISSGLKKIPVFPLTLFFFFFFFFFVVVVVFCADPAIFIAFQKKKRRLSYLQTLKCFRNLDKKLKTEDHKSCSAHLSAEDMLNSNKLGNTRALNAL